MKALIRIVKYHLLLLVPLLCSLALYFVWCRFDFLSLIINFFVYAPYSLVISYFIINELSKCFVFPAAFLGALSIYASWIIQRHSMNSLSFESVLILGYVTIASLVVVILGNTVMFFSSFKKKSSTLNE